MSNWGDIWVGVNIIEEDGTFRYPVFPIYPSDETLIAMLKARHEAYEAGLRAFGEAKGALG